MEKVEDEFVAINGFVSSEAEFEADNVKMKVDILSYMNENNLMDLQPGTYEMNVKFDLPEGMWIRGDVQVQVKISDK